MDNFEKLIESCDENLKFYSPQGMSDTKFEELTTEQQIDQKYWNEFIKGKQPL